MVGSITGTVLSGLHAASTRIAVAADNIANASTPNYAAKTVQQTSMPSGVQADVVPTEKPVDMAEQLVQANVASYDFKANIKVLQAAQNLSKHLFDIQA